MVDNEESNEHEIELTDARKFSWFVVALIVVDGAEDIVGNVSETIGKLRCHMVGHLRWSNRNEKVLREIEALPETPVKG